MKFFKRLLNKIESETAASNAKHDDSDAIFSLASASLLLEEKLGLKFSKTAALCIKIINGGLFKNTINDCTGLLDVSKEEFKFDYKIFTDSFDYLWIIINGKDLPTNSDIITNVAAALSSTGDIIEEHGFSNQILSAIFQFKFFDIHNNSTINYKNDNSYNNKKNLYLIYNYKTNNFYPYIPIDNVYRDASKELQVLSILKSVISVEEDFSKWFPIKGIPF
ncbi:MAG: hypothetical protein H0X50_07300 [Nitrosopumilus sp.]|nr:hypothetical protein [Nitrosopumilus sp.]